MPRHGDAGPGGPPLDVAVDQPASNNSDDYPPTARFIEGPKGHTLIGVKCANRWCAIGPRGFTEIPKSAHDTVPGLVSAVQGRVKGWFDDQVLGVPDGQPNHRIHRQFRASAIPDRNLALLHIQDFMVPAGQETYKTVGVVYFPQDPDVGSKYVQVFGFSRGINVVSMRAEKSKDANGNPDTTWYTQVKNARGEVKPDIHTHRTDHSKSITGLWYGREDSGDHALALER